MEVKCGCCGVKIMLWLLLRQSNRYPLHYAYSLPPEQSRSFVALLLERNPEDVETRLDCVRRRDVSALQRLAVSHAQRLAAMFSIFMPLLLHLYLNIACC